ncbi:MAG: hypothetical protein IKO55_17110 [Kiritimatiellae bacterium]|nr:hypothetical protein [Kiritimatiellia bacterium]
MRFGYAYKTSDGVRHEASMEAPSREAVFEALRARGIRPIKVVAADGSKANGEESRRGARLPARVLLVLAVALVLVILALLPKILENRSDLFSNKSQEGRTALPRHQLYGDPAMLEDIERDGFASVFPHVGDRILAAYAIPGRPVSPEIRRIPPRELAKAIAASMNDDVAIAETDSPEAAELKRIVQGMKEELRWYVGDGVGTASSYLSRLEERQEEEIRIYERTRMELETCTDQNVREERNAALRAMGLRTIPRPRKDPRLPQQGQQL